MCLLETKWLCNQITEALPAVFTLSLPLGRVADVHVHCRAYPVLTGTHVLLEEVPHDLGSTLQSCSKNSMIAKPDIHVAMQTYTYMHTRTQPSAAQARDRPALSKILARTSGGHWEEPQQQFEHDHSFYIYNVYTIS